MQAKKDVDGLIKSLNYEKSCKVRSAAADALSRLDWKPNQGKTCTLI